MLRFTTKIPVLIIFLISVFTAYAATPGFDTLVNYDTTWTYIHDGGMQLGNLRPMYDALFDVKEYAPNSCIAVGVSGDTSNSQQSLLLKFDEDGKIVLKKMYDTFDAMNTFFNAQELHSVIIARNGDYIVGGSRFIGPLVMRLDKQGEIKWTYWFYDSLSGIQGMKIDCDGSVNSIKETSQGTIIGAIGYHFTLDSYVFGDRDYNCAGALILDSTARKLHGGELNNESGYFISGTSIEEAPDGSYLIAGNQTLNYIDTGGNTKWQKRYNFMLDGVGQVVNNIVKCKKLRDDSYLIAGQAYEGNCWTNYEKLYYDAWWSPVDPRSGTIETWDTAGIQGGTDEMSDFTQLNNGNLVFIGGQAGKKALWTFVTDSTGSRVLWEKSTGIPYRSNKGTVYPTPISVCATADSGFTVVGRINYVDTLGGNNAFVMHFAPREKTGVTKRTAFPVHNYLDFKIHCTGSYLNVQPSVNNGLLTEISLFDLQGKRILTKTGKNELRIDISKISRGAYFIRVNVNGMKGTKKLHFLPTR